MTNIMARGLKQSANMYRNINGVYFRHAASNPDDFELIKVEAKEKGLKVRKINGELFIQRSEEDIKQDNHRKEIVTKFLNHGR